MTTAPINYNILHGYAFGTLCKFFDIATTECSAKRPNELGIKCTYRGFRAESEQLPSGDITKRMNFLDCPHGEEQSIFYREADTSDNTD